MANENLTNAKRAKNDEFYTQYYDIQQEMEAYLEFDADVFRGKVVYCNCDDPYESNFFRYFVLNFNRIGLKQLITTSYHPSPIANTQLELFGGESAANGDGSREATANRFCIIVNEVEDRDADGSFGLGVIARKLQANKHNEWAPLEGNGDFRSPECVELLKQADIIATNPPFSLFREYVQQLFDYDKQFVIIGNMNAITYKEIFPLIKENRLWLGATGYGNDMVFAVLNGSEIAESDRQKAARLGYVGDYTRLGNSCWFSNLDHGRRHQPMTLMTMEDNKRFNRKISKNENGYKKYDNYDAIEVPYTNAIPSDYDGVMGVPISFLDKYNPDQFEIMGLTKTWFGGASKTYPAQTQVSANGKRSEVTKLNDGATLEIPSPPIGQTYYMVGKRCYIQVYARVLIQHKRGSK